MRLSTILFLLLAGLFLAVATVFAIYQGYKEDVGSEPVDNLLEIAIFGVLAIGFGFLAYFDSRGPAPDVHDEDERQSAPGRPEEADAQVMPLPQGWAADRMNPPRCSPLTLISTPLLACSRSVARIACVGWPNTWMRTVASSVCA